MESKEALAVARSIAMQVKLGNLSYEDGKSKARPYIKIAEKGIKEIAEKYGKKPHRISWAGLIR